MKDMDMRLLDRITDAFVALDEEWRFVFVNPQAAEILGHDRQELLGSDIWATFPDLIGEDFHTLCLQAMDQQVPTQIERCSTRLGRWIENRIYPSPDGLTIFFTDVTERKSWETSLRQYQDIFRFAEVGLVIGTDDGARLGAMNPAFARMHGYEIAELEGRSTQEVYAPEARAELPTFIRQTEQMGHTVYKSHHIRKDGTIFPVSVDSTAVKDEQGRVLYRIVNVTDITESKQTHEALQEAVRRLETLIASLQTGVLVEDSNGQIVLTNQTLCDMVGADIPPAALIGARMSLFAQHVRSFFAQPDRLLVRLSEIHQERHPIQGEELVLTDGRVFELDYSPVLTEGSDGYHLWQLRDVTDRRQIERQLRDTSAVLQAQKRELEKVNARLEELATNDGLTGLLNQRVFGERLSEEILRSRRYATPLSLIVLDVDRFKSYNDSFGHLAGNSVLRELAVVLREHARETDLVARFGGEEFALILPHTEVGEAAALAERLRAALSERVWSAQYPITASFGVCELTGEMGGPDGLVACADAAMYRAKANGRNTVFVAPS